MKRIFIQIIFILSLLVSVQAQKVWTVTNADVLDGDTIRISFEGKTYKVRLVGIDAPESKQSFGTESKAKLAEFIQDKSIIVKWSKVDNNERILGQVFVGKTDINLEMLKLGLAWIYYVQNVPKLERKEYISAFAKTQANKIGLFANVNAVEPRLFRKAEKCKE
ncbi:MAG: thermonuclease family protein [Pyrinomonadaceae bacterium]|jgi:endonuclease YncB( thermonuclease family)|nr:thermonuclease family protein [Pyrinomonadaceae bacterium]